MNGRKIESVYCDRSALDMVSILLFVYTVDNWAGD
jgi:hypothetical protein